MPHSHFSVAPSVRNRCRGGTNFADKTHSVLLLKTSIRKASREVFTLTSAFFSRKFCKHNSSTADVSLILKRKKCMTRNKTHLRHTKDSLLSANKKKSPALSRSGKSHFHPPWFSACRTKARRQVPITSPAPWEAM